MSDPGNSDHLIILSSGCSCKVKSVRSAIFLDCFKVIPLKKKEYLKLSKTWSSS